MGTSGFPGQYPQPPDDIPFAVMIHRVQFTILFNDYQTRSTLNNIGLVFDRTLNHEALARFNMPVGHFLKERAAIFLEKKL